MMQCSSINGKMISMVCIYSCFSSLDDHSKCFTIQFIAIHPFTHIHIVHLWAALSLRGAFRVLHLT